MSTGQANQAANPDKQKTADSPQTEGSPRKEGGTRIDKEAAERGRKIFVPTCGFCQGNDAHGKSGPDLVRFT